MDLWRLCADGLLSISLVYYTPRALNSTQPLTDSVGLAVNLLMLLFLTHISFPRARPHTRKFFELSYYNPESGEYCIGWSDAWLVAYWIVVFTGLRAAVMDYVLFPFAKRGGVKTEKDQTRFAEQAWLLIYDSIFWSLGMVCKALC